MNQLCRVCGEEAAGFHFGAFTCEGCKSFFGRTHDSLESLAPCKNNNTCVISKTNRTACKRCRLRKCINVGMSKAGSRFGRRSNWFKVHCQIQGTPSNASSDPAEHQDAAISELARYAAKDVAADNKLETKSIDSGIHSPEWDNFIGNRSPQHIYAGGRRSSPHTSPTRCREQYSPKVDAHRSSSRKSAPQISPGGMKRLSLNESFPPNPHINPLFTSSSSQGPMYMSTMFPASKMYYKSSRSPVQYPVPKIMPAMYLCRAPYYGTYMPSIIRNAARPWLPFSQPNVSEREPSHTETSQQSRKLSKSDQCEMCSEKIHNRKSPYPQQCIHKIPQERTSVSVNGAAAELPDQPLDLSKTSLAFSDAYKSGDVKETEMPLDLSTKSQQMTQIEYAISKSSTKQKGKAKWETPKFRAIKEYYRKKSEEDASTEPIVTEESTGLETIQNYPKCSNSGETIFDCQETFPSELTLRSTLV